MNEISVFSRGNKSKYECDIARPLSFEITSYSKCYNFPKGMVQCLGERLQLMKLFSVLPRGQFFLWDFVSLRMYKQIKVFENHRKSFFSFMKHNSHT